MPIDPVTKNYITPTKSSTSTPAPAPAKPSTSSGTSSVQTPAATYTKSTDAEKAAVAAPQKTASGAVYAIAKSDKEIKENIASVKANAKPLQIGGAKPSAAPAETSTTSKTAATVNSQVAAAANTESKPGKTAPTNVTYSDKNPVNKEEIMAAASEMRKSLKSNVDSAVAGAALGRGTQYQAGSLPKVVTKPTPALQSTPNSVDLAG